ncbi:hypothetical protein HME7025_01188 [Aquirufa nivalisilvae]|uniref:Uncharacterized protein n=1 Tax=Aquirufa nivalisilvae TaxID=2516557 RepID=A0A2S2DUG8_9BACT|nr:hypothetical protein [Aquirufa nivalisilvae]AWL09051.1 hypothetical protein HME7025_01188 [Aquirufa nivalisilvae]
MKANEKIFTNDLRDKLKAIMSKEIEKLPEMIEKLETREKVNVLCKLMPFVVPKVESVHPKEGEPFTFD